MVDTFRWPSDDEAVEVLDLERGTIEALARSSAAAPVATEVAAAAAAQDVPRAPIRKDVAAAPIARESSLAHSALEASAARNVRPPEHHLAGEERRGFRLPAEKTVDPPVAAAPATLHRSPSKRLPVPHAADAGDWRRTARRWALPALATVVIIESALLARGVFENRARTESSAAATVHGVATAGATADVSQPSALTRTENPAVSDPITTGDNVESNVSAVPPSSPAQAMLPIPVAASGRVALSLPFQVEVYEQGRLVGFSSGNNLRFTAGTHQLELVNESLQYRASQRVVVYPNQTTTVVVQLPSGTLHVNATPWAQVIIDGRSYGETPLANLQLPIGSHRIVFRHPQLGEQTRTVVVLAQSVTRLGVDLQK